MQPRTVSFFPGFARTNNCLFFFHGRTQRRTEGDEAGQQEISPAMETAPGEGRARLRATNGLLAAPWGLVGGLSHGDVVVTRRRGSPERCAAAARRAGREPRWIHATGRRVRGRRPRRLSLGLAALSSLAAAPGDVGQGIGAPRRGLSRVWRGRWWANRRPVQRRALAAGRRWQGYCGIATRQGRTGHRWGCSTNGNAGGECTGKGNTPESWRVGCCCRERAGGLRGAHGHVRGEGREKNAWGGRGRGISCAPGNRRDETALHDLDLRKTGGYTTARCIYKKTEVGDGCPIYRQLHCDRAREAVVNTTMVNTSSTVFTRNDILMSPRKGHEI
jgi:hypothetical protein